MNNKSISKKNKLVKITLPLLIILVVGFAVIKVHDRSNQNKSESFISASLSNNDSIKHVVSLIIIALPYKTSYYEGEVFDPGGITLKVIWSDGVEDELRSLDVEFEDKPIQKGTTSIRVTYEGVSVDIPIEVVSEWFTSYKVKNIIKVKIIIWRLY